MKKVNWAIIIPSWREERLIGKLLDSLINQTVCPKEIIVVDAFSDDKTKSEVESRQSSLKCLKFLQIPKSTISKQRNFGVLHTKAPNILFLDADVVFKSNNTLEKYVAEIEKRSPDIAFAETLPASVKLVDRIYYCLIFWHFLKIMRPFYPLATAMNLYVKRDTFSKLGGFDEKIKVGEDHNLVQRMVHKGHKFIFLNDPKFINSIRRIKKEGRIGYLLKSLRLGLYSFQHGFSDVPKEIPYEFGNYDNDDQER